MADLYPSPPPNKPSSFTKSLPYPILPFIDHTHSTLPSIYMAEHVSEVQQQKTDIDFILNHYSASRRTLNSIHELWHAANQEDADATTKIFLGDGTEQCFYAWYAFTLLRHDSQKSSHFTGKATCAQVVVRISSSPESYQASIAAGVRRGINGDAKMRTTYQDLTQSQLRKRPRQYSKLCYAT